jgi:hypothetical protein
MSLIICHALRKKSPSTSLPYIVQRVKSRMLRSVVDGSSAGVGELGKSMEDPMKNSSCAEGRQTGTSDYGKGGEMCRRGSQAGSVYNSN